MAPADAQDKEFSFTNYHEMNRRTDPHKVLQIMITLFNQTENTDKVNYPYDHYTLSSVMFVYTTVISFRLQ